jgi:hypothetical protein
LPRYLPLDSGSRCFRKDCREGVCATPQDGDNITAIDVAAGCRRIFLDDTYNVVPDQIVLCFVDLRAVERVVVRLGAVAVNGTLSCLYLLDLEAEPRPTIEFYNFATRRTRPVLTLDMQPSRAQPSLSATMDGRTIYSAQHDRQNVIKMMDIAN